VIDIYSKVEILRDFGKDSDDALWSELGNVPHKPAFKQSGNFFFFFFKFASLRHHKVQNCLRLDSYKLHFVVIFLKDQNFVCDGDGEISNLNHNKIYQCQQIFE